MQHLPLQRVDVERSRKRRPGFFSPPERDNRKHGRSLHKQLSDLEIHLSESKPPEGIDPRCILKIQLNDKARFDEEAWGRCAFTLLSENENKMLVLFASDKEMTGFKQHLAQYRKTPPPTQKEPSYNQFFASIDAISHLQPQDRIGCLLKSENRNTPEDFDNDTTYILDVELWHLGTDDLRDRVLQEITDFIKRKGGLVTDSYRGDSLLLCRVKCSGSIVQQLLELDDVAMIDLPPQPDITIHEILHTTIGDFGSIHPPDDDAPSVAVLDSGIAAGHPLLAPAIGEATSIPSNIGDSADEHGHGTMVAGLALYGDIKECVESKSFVPKLKIYSARVLNK